SAIETTKKGVGPPRDDIGPASAGSLALKDAEIEELRNAKRMLEVKVAGLESEVNEFQIAIRKWEETDAVQRTIIAQLQTENAALRARVADAAPPADDGLEIPECLRRSAL